MGTKLKPSDHYVIPAYYSVETQVGFERIKTVTLNSSEYAEVEKVQFDKMIEDYKLKMKIS